MKSRKLRRNFDWQFACDYGLKECGVVIGIALNAQPFPASYDLGKIIASSGFLKKVFVKFYSTERNFDWLKMQVFSLIDFLVFYMVYSIDLLVIHQQHLPLLCIISRLMRIKTVIYIGGKPFDGSHKQNQFNRLLQQVGNIGWHICFLFSTFIVIPIRELNNYFELQKYSHKILSAPTRMINQQLFRAFCKLSERPDKVAYIGRFSYEKGTDIAIKTFLRVLEMFPQVSFVMIGDGPLMPLVKQTIRKYNCMGKIEITGWLSATELVNNLNHVKLVLVSSRTEGVPSVILESMACGTPVLASNVGGTSCIIKNNFNGFLFDTFDPDSIAAKIVSVLKNEDMLEFVSNNARNFVMANYSEENVQKSWLSILRRLLA